jgi:hypothetical protein
MSRYLLLLCGFAPILAAALPAMPVALTTARRRHIFHRHDRFCSDRATTNPLSSLRAAVSASLALGRPSGPPKKQFFIPG